MEMRAIHWTQPRWTAAAVSGFIGGAVVMVLEFIASIVSDVSPWSVPNMVAAITMGEGVIAPAFQLNAIIVALVTHYVLGVIFGMVFAAIATPLHLDNSPGTVLVTGAVFGLFLYLLNFYGISRLFPWFEEMREWGTIWAHVIFGMSVAFIYWQMGDRAEA